MDKETLFKHSDEINAHLVCDLKATRGVGDKRMTLKPKSRIEHLKRYEPGRPIEDVARDLGLDPNGIEKLASNENALGPSPLALRAIREAAATVHLYTEAMN